MTATPSAAPAPDTASGPSLYLSVLIGRPLADRSGQPLGRLADVIVRLRGAEHPLVTGLVAAVGGREVFVPIEQVSSFAGDVLKLTSAKLDLRRFERREGEVLLRADVLGHRLIDVGRARLVRAGDLQLSRKDGEWVLGAVDTRWRPRRLLGLLGGHEQTHDARDWSEFEPLIGDSRSAGLRGPFARIRRLKPAQIADLLEEASKAGSNAILLIIAIVGTTVAPWQLFFQQSNVIDKRITPRFMGYERADTVLGSFVVVVGAGAIVIVADYAVRGTGLAGHFTDALGVANALGHKDTVLGAMFAIVLLDASIIGAAAVTLATSYAFGDMFGIKHSLHRSFRDAKAFYASYTGVVAAAAAIVLIPHTPLGLVTEAVQALAGVLLPSASTFLLLLCNDAEVLGPWVNPGWLNGLATVVIAALLMLSATLMATTLFPHVDAARTAMWLSVALAAGLTATGIALRVSRNRRGAAVARPVVPREARSGWRMPPLALLKPVAWSPARRLALLAMYGYLVIAVLLLVIKAAQLAAH